MIIKASYFIVRCDYTEERGRCEAHFSIYVPPESEGAASEYAMREISAEGWKRVSRGRRNFALVFCPEHKGSDMAKQASK